MSIEEFGKHLLDSNDLDPVYVALRKSLYRPEDQLKRWLVAYWCWYDCGAASFLSEKVGQDFWAFMELAAANEVPAPTGGRWPRAKERRHARGKQALQMVERLSALYPEPEGFVDYVAVAAEGRPLTCGEVMDRVKGHYLFGHWIGFKVADMLDRVVGVPVAFDQAHTFMFEDPKLAALMVWRRYHKLSEGAVPRNLDEALRGVVDYLSRHFDHYMAPPLYDRPVGLQEVETILCKWKSHVNGHYPPFNDQREICGGLQRWIPHCKTAERFHQAMPKETDVKLTPFA